VFLVSAALFTYEIILIKVFAIIYWHHFASLIVSLALLGFGASGALFMLFRGGLKGRLASALYLFSLLIALAIWINTFLARLISFNPLMIVWQPKELVDLVLLSLFLMTPFLLGALCVVIAFSLSPDDIFGIYFANLAGSGVGSLFILLTFFHVGPHEITLIISFVILCAAPAASTSRRRTTVAAIALIALVPLYLVLLHPTTIPMSPFKDLSIARNQAGARIEREVFGPFGLVTVLDSPAYHYLPDLSLNCPCRLPRQKGLFLNGDAVGAINGPGDRCFMEWRTASLPYHLLKSPSVLIIGGGGGGEILNARHHRAREISVVEMNHEIVSLLQRDYSAFCGGLYDPAQMQIFSEDGRGYLERTQRTFDLIQISLLESMESASAGVYSLNENYLLTREALQCALRRLAPGGILSISQWIKSPPRESLKMLATAIAAVGTSNAARSLVMIRSWQTATLLVKNGEFSASQIEAVKGFCRERLFDLCYYPGIQKGEANVVNKLDQSYFFNAAERLLSGDAEQFYAEYPFYIRPATDDRPFFAHTFKPSVMKKYLSRYGKGSIPFLDWGYILLWAALAILVVLSLALIIIPIKIAGRATHRKTSIFLYFGALGLAYMFLEISFLQHFIRYLYDPVFSATVVIGSFLVYSGIGSLIAGGSGLHPRIGVPAAVAGIVGAAILYLLAEGLLAKMLFRLPLGMRMAISSLLIAPIAVPMGIPFPAGLSRLAKEDEALLPWAWGINGFLSVIGASAAILIAIRWGFVSVVIGALALYLLAACVYKLRFRIK